LRPASTALIASAGFLSVAKVSLLFWQEPLLELLYHLAASPNRVFTRNQLLDEVWGFDYFGNSRTVDVHIKRLREKLEGVSDQWSLKTVWGVGYKFEAVNA
ncbi:winged helix-turn-helix domain-containing protein, partial [Intestinimonas massiliensis]|uniref:winged helix-turn-helix domain-containing protein n=1 Tax=Intestinimonas massiliensis (ex Afouda et al. 2020) TaxID=1673721 RepID=UPI00210C85DF